MVSAQELSAKKTATKPIARNITCGTRMCGRRLWRTLVPVQAGEGGDAEAQRGADARPGERVRVEGVQGEALLGGVGDGDVEDDDERHLDHQEDAEYERVDVDLQPGKRADGEDGAISAGIHQATSTWA